MRFWKTAAAITLPILLLGATSASQAASLLGDTVNISYYYPDISTLFLDFGTKTLVTSETIFDTGSSSPYLYFTVDSDSVSFIAKGDVDLTPTSFNGFIFTDLSKNVSFSLDGSSTISTVDSSRITSTANSFAVNMSGLGVKQGATLIFSLATVSPVPEPQTYALLLTGLGLVAFVGLRRKPVGRFAIPL